MERKKHFTSSFKREDAVPSGQNNKCRVFVGNLHHSVSEGDLIKLCQSVASVKSVFYLWHRSGPLRGKPKGYAFVEFATELDSAKAIRKLAGMNLRGRTLAVNYSDSNPHAPSDTFVDPSIREQRENSSSEGGKRTREDDAKDLSTKRATIRDLDDKIRKLQEALSAPGK